MICLGSEALLFDRDEVIHARALIKLWKVRYLNILSVNPTNLLVPSLDKNRLSSVSEDIN